MYMQLLEGRDVCPSAEPYEARVDVLVSTQPDTEAKWLRNVTMEIDYVRYMYTCSCIIYTVQGGVVH